LAYLRKGTIITISNEPTDMTYFPFAPNSTDWKLNINVSDLTNKSGTFNLNDNKIDISLEDSSGVDILLAKSGEGIWSDVVDNQEVYKLKDEPDKTITPFDNTYGDDNDLSVLSTFSYPNQWIENGVTKTQDLIIRNNLNLVETDGIVTANIDNLNLKDGESLQYVAPNNSLWITDDDSNSVFEIDLTTKELKSTFTDEDFGTFASDIQDECQYGVGGVCDIESVSYDANNDDLYIFVGHSGSSTASVFKLTRGDTNASFAISDYRKLNGVEYPASIFINGDLIVSTGKELYKYNFNTNQLVGSSLYYSSNNSDIVGLAYSNNILYMTTLNYDLMKLNWQTKELISKYSMNDNGVYDPRGIEVIDNKLYILDGVNSSGNGFIAPQGSPLKGAIHIY
jgi:hypothetical protein